MLRSDQNHRLVDQSHYISNISQKLDLLLENKKFANEKSSTHWLYALLFISIGINLILIIVYIYRKKKMYEIFSFQYMTSLSIFPFVYRNPISKYILAKFHTDREEVILGEKLTEE